MHLSTRQCSSMDDPEAAAQVCDVPSPVRRRQRLCWQVQAAAGACHGCCAVPGPAGPAISLRSGMTPQQQGSPFQSYQGVLVLLFQLQQTVIPRACWACTGLRSQLRLWPCCSQLMTPGKRCSQRSTAGKPCDGDWEQGTRCTAGVCILPCTLPQPAVSQLARGVCSRVVKAQLCRCKQQWLRARQAGHAEPARGLPACFGGAAGCWAWADGVGPIAVSNKCVASCLTLRLGQL